MTLACKKCGSTCVIPCQSGTRCNQCGHQSIGIEPQLDANYKTRQPDGSKPRYYPSRILIEAQQRIEGEIAVYAAEQAASQTAAPKPPLDETLKVSVIIPTFKREHTIADTLKSIYDQSYTNWEVIVIDNEPGHLYAFDNPKVRYYQHPEVRGAAFARNKGVEYVKGDLVVFFDDDDMMHQDYLEVMVAPFKNPKIQATSCLIKLVEGYIATHTTFCTPTVVIRKAIATPTWKPRIEHDKIYFTEIIAKLDADTVINIPKVLCYSTTSPQGGLRDGLL